MLLFSSDDHQRVARGDVTVTWRLWKYAHVKPGRTYPTGFGFVEIDDVRQVRAADVTEDDAREAGWPNAPALIDFARSHTGAEVKDDTVLYRVDFRYLGESDPRPRRPSLNLEQVVERLNRLDSTGRGPWTLTALRLIEEQPRIVARRLAYSIGWDPGDFKAHVRKLKALGLTISCEVGYELSELGQSYLDSRERLEDDVESTFSSSAGERE